MLVVFFMMVVIVGMIALVIIIIISVGTLDDLFLFEQRECIHFSRCFFSSFE